MLSGSIGRLRLFPVEKLYIGELFIRNTQYANFPDLREHCPNPSHVDFGILHTRTMAYVNRELEHSESIFHQGLTEVSIGFLLLLGFRRQVEEHENPHNPIFTETIKPHHDNLHFRIADTSDFSRETFDKRGRRLLCGNHQRTSFSIDDDIQHGDAQKLHLQFFRQNRYILITTDDVDDQLVDIRAVWFHHIIGQTITIITVMMMNTQCGQQSASHQ